MDQFELGIPRPKSLTKNIVLNGDCRKLLPTLEADSINCVITSPPYWGLRDYGTATWEGGDPDCEHTISMPKKWNDPKRGKKYTRPEVANRGGDASKCFNCGAKRIDQQIGLESTHLEYVETIVNVFKEIKRVLRPDGTVWLNLGDSYIGSGKASSNPEYAKKHKMFGKVGKTERHGVVMPIPKGLKKKDLAGVPWRVALALQDDGWWLRSDIIWYKPNKMPESVKDRPTMAHEYIFLLTKSSKYWYDHKAILEPYTEPINRWGGTKLKADGLSLWDEGTGQATYRDRNMRPDPDGKNKRSVWTVINRPYKGAHFATFSEELITPCVLAGCPEGGTILDPFGGANTTGMVAKKYKRNSISIELKPEYCDLDRVKSNK